MKYIGMLNSKEIIFFDDTVPNYVNAIHYSDIGHFIKHRGEDIVYFSLNKCQFMTRLFKSTYINYTTTNKIKIKIIPESKIDKDILKYMIKI